MGMGDSAIGNASLDLLEEHQAKEQARLLHRFKELRQWQQQQQQQLMQQQQQQLKAWQDEQSKLQLLIANQQGVPWNKGLKPGTRGQQSGILTPPSKPHIVAANNAQKDSVPVHRSLGAGVSLDSGLAASMQDTLKSQSSLPKPVMYINPSASLNPNDEDKYTDSELFSNPGSHDDDFDILKGDDSHPAPDWISDNSDNFVPPKLPPPRPIRVGRNGGISDKLAGLEQLLTTAPPELLQQVLSMLPVKERMDVQPNYSDEVELSASPTLPNPGQLPRSRKLQFQEPVPASILQTSFSSVASLSQQEQQLNQLRHQQQRLQNKNNVIKNVIPDPQKLNLGPMFMECEQEPEYIPRGLILADDRNLLLKREMSDSAHSDEWEDQEDDDEEDSDSYDDQNVTAKEVHNVSSDDRPVIGLTNKKSFEQLLEEQLKAEEIKPENQKVTDKSLRKPFLKKGEGISRFNSAPKKRPKNVSNKLDRKSTVVHANGLGKGVAKGTCDSEVNQPLDIDGNKKLPVGFGLKDTKKPASVAKPKERKMTSKTISGTLKTTTDKSRVKPAFIQNVSHKKMEEFEKNPQQKEFNNCKADKEQIDQIRNGILNEIDMSPIPDSKSNKSDDRESYEMDSLAEFELLENVMDNISFSSNSSLVQKLLINDRQGQKEVMNRLKTVNESKKASNVVPANTSPETINNGFIRDTVTSNCRGQTLNGNNSNNNSNNNNVETAAVASELSDGTLTDSSDEENTDGRRIRKSDTASQIETVTNSISASNSDQQQSPSKVMPRKVASLASKFAAANDTLSMLKALSLRAGFLTANNAPFTVHTNVNATSEHGHISSTVSSSVSENPGFVTSDCSRNHHIIGSSTNYSIAPTIYSESNHPLNDLKLNSAPAHYGDSSHSSAAFGQWNWSEPKHLPSNVTSSQVTGDDVSQFNAQIMNNDIKGKQVYIQKKSYNSHQYEISSDTDESDDTSDLSDDDDDLGKADKIKLTSVDDTNLGGSSISQTQSGNRKVINNSEPHVASRSTCFDDETSWVDEEEEENLNDNNSCLKTIGSTEPMTANNSSTPPTSKLMSRLFPKLKPKQSIETGKVNQTLQQASTQPVNLTNGIQSHILREKLMELDKEIERFRSENANLEILRREREEGLSKLKQEIENFQREKEAELKRLEEFKTEELKKLKRERKLFDSYQKKVRSMPDKRDREEIDVLKIQLQELQDELKRKESRWNASTGRLKNRLEELELENGELKEEIRILEKKRLEWMTAQSSVKTSVQSNGKIGSGDSGQGKYGGAGRQTSTSNIRSSTPTKDVDKIQVSSSAGLRDGNSAGVTTGASRPTVANVTSGNSGTLRSAVANVTSANIGGNKSGKAGTSSNSIQSSQGASLSSVTNGTGAAAIKGAVLKPLTPAPVHTNLSGDGLQNNPLPMMIENTLPQAAQTSAMPGSLASSINSGSKTSALAAMERAVIDKGDVLSFMEIKHQDGKVEKTFKTGAKEIHFPNGTVKEVSADGQTIICRLANGDMRQIFPDHRVVYVFAEAQIMQTTYPDGLETFEFKNGQLERRYPDGTVEITFPSKDVKFLFPDGGQEVILNDGTVMQYNTKGERIIEYPSGDREVHTAEYQRREFPDGIVKTVYSDGRHETCFPNGRIRLKDNSGNVIMDQIVLR